MSLLLWLHLVLVLLLPDAMLPVHMIEPSSSVMTVSSCQLLSSAPSVSKFQFIVSFIISYLSILIHAPSFGNCPHVQHMFSCGLSELSQHTKWTTLVKCYNV